MPPRAVNGGSVKAKGSIVINSLDGGTKDRVGLVDSLHSSFCSGTGYILMQVRMMKHRKTSKCLLNRKKRSVPGYA
jgi:hypothetical protein